MGNGWVVEQKGLLALLTELKKKRMKMKNEKEERTFLVFNEKNCCMKAFFHRREKMKEKKNKNEQLYS